jgi:hypothetical protein
VELYNATLCILLLDLTSRSGVVTGVYVHAYAHHLFIHFSAILNSGCILYFCLYFFSDAINRVSLGLFYVAVWSLRFWPQRTLVG